MLLSWLVPSLVLSQSLSKFSFGFTRLVVASFIKHSYPAVPTQISCCFLRNINQLTRLPRCTSYFGPIYRGLIPPSAAVRIQPTLYHDTPTLRTLHDFIQALTPSCKSLSVISCLRSKGTCLAPRQTAERNLENSLMSGFQLLRVWAAWVLRNS